MPVFQRKDSSRIFKEIDQGRPAPVYLLVGERYLCREASDELIARLLPDEDQRRQQLKIIDGAEENPAHTLTLLRTYHLFGDRQVFRVTDTKLFDSRNISKSLWEKASGAQAAGDTQKAGRLLGRLFRAAGQTPSRQEAEELLELSEEGWREIFGFARPQGNLTWVQDCLPNGPGQEEILPAGRDAGDELIAALEAGLPVGNILVLLAEAVDKRKRLYKYIGKRGVILDLTVDTGSSSSARKDQEAVLRELAEKSFAALGKKIEPRALPVLLERVGFHPVAVVMESEKLALHAGEASTVTLADLDLLIGRTREEALFELTEAVGSRDLAAALTSLGRLQEGQVHALVIVAGLRNFLKKLLWARSFQDRGEPAYRRGMSFPAFKKAYLPQLKEGSGERQPQLLGSHPFVVYKTFRQAEGFSITPLREALALLLAAEYRLKSSRLPERLVLQHFLLHLFLKTSI